MVWMWLVGGPNGSGKSTLASTEIISQLPGSPLIRFNPDDLSKKLRNENTTLAQVEINIRAVRTIDAQVAKTIEERKSFLTETVLSTDKYKHMVNRAKELDFSIGLLFVTLVRPNIISNVFDFALSAVVMMSLSIRLRADGINRSQT